ncbi:MAG: DUF2089 family protein [Planctomycetota bacterium]|nr:DUF2089 family protein [Planctomycetota bacterium]
MTLHSLNTAPSKAPEHPLLALPREDLDLITELVLRSGSLKGLAEAYSVSYPTIRTRVDRVIGRLRETIEGRQPDELTELLATLLERGEITASAARRVRDTARQAAAHASSTSTTAPTPGTTHPKGDTR